MTSSSWSEPRSSGITLMLQETTFPKALNSANHKDPYDAAAAIVGDSLLADAKLAPEALNDAIPEVKSRPAPAAPQIERKLPSPPNSPLTALRRSLH